MKTAVMRAEAVPPETPKGSRKQSTDCTDCTDCTETSKMASSRQTWVERVVAGLAGTLHPGRQKWRNGRPHGRRRAVAGRSFSPSIIGGCFSKRTHMMTPVKIEKRRFPVETVCFDLQGWANQKGVFTKRTQMIQPRPSVFHRLLQCRRASYSQRHFQAAAVLSAPCLWLRPAGKPGFLTATKT